VRARQAFRFLRFGCGVLCASACARTPASVGSGTDGGPADAGPSRVTRLLFIENRRVAGAVGAEDIGDRDPAVRRAAARALARIASPSGVPLLFQTLSDEDPEVVAWSAYGLGYACGATGIDANEIVRALTVRAVSMPDAGAGALDPIFAIARALGRCATDDAERTLAEWVSLADRRAPFAAFALGDVASRKKALAEPTQLALLSAAAGGATAAPLAEALYPFGRLDHPLSSATDRLFEIATLRLKEPSSSRIFAVRALGRCDPGAAAELRRVLVTPGAFTPAERAEAARSLGRLGDAGQRALGEALPSLVPGHDLVSETSLGTAAFGPLLVALETIRNGESVAPKRLYELAALPVPDNAPPTLARRIVKLRCRAAALLVNGKYDDPLVAACDPEGGEVGQRAELDALARRKLEGRRLARFHQLLASKPPRVREAAIELLAEHPEVSDAQSLVAQALAAPEPGVVATAAQLLAGHPDRADAETGGKLREALERKWAPDDIETLGALLDATGAIHDDALAPTLEAYCRNTNPTLREHAARGLSLLKRSKVVCDGALEPAPPAAEIQHLAAQPVKLELTTDAGIFTLTLDPSTAPVAVTRMVDLARAGFYDGISFHRVVPGFVVQFGDPGGDGFGGPKSEPLRCETTPLPFEALDVGVALAGRDTGSSQLFVTLARYPHLDEEYAKVGRAEGDWSTIAEGDVVRTAKVLP
jgi:cyclophilin family peptidyl-prolyl cis-trans isomerase